MPNKQVDEVTLKNVSVDIERFNQFKILCFTLISHLNWIKHIDKDSKQMFSNYWTYN